MTERDSASHLAQPASSEKQHDLHSDRSFFQTLFGHLGMYPDFNKISRDYLNYFVFLIFFGI